MNHSKWLFGIVFLIFVMCMVWLCGISDHITLEQLKLYRVHLHNFVNNNYLLSMVLYILSCAIATLLCLPIGVVLTIAGGFLFGTLLGAVCADIGVTLGAGALFLLVRYAFGIWLQQRYAKELVQYNKHVQRYGAQYLLFMQLLPITPTFLINIIAGMTTITWWTFVWTTAVGIFPGSLVYTFAGQQLNNIETIDDIFSYPMLFLFVLLALLALVPIFVTWCRDSK